MVDEISLACDYTYDISEDKVVGHVDLGSLGRRNEPADPALVFMINGLKRVIKATDCLLFYEESS